MKIEAKETQTTATRIAACGARRMAGDGGSAILVLVPLRGFSLKAHIPGTAMPTPRSGGSSMRVEDIRKVCVLGAGAMGAGIAQVCAQAGYAVAMRDIDHKFVEAGFNRIRGPLMKRVDKGKMTADEVEDIVSRIEGTVDVAVAVKGAQLVIEAVPEKMELKKAVWTEADRAAGLGTVFASNTSSLSITEMAASTRRPADFVGMHFFNPAPVMKLVEVIRGSETSKATVDFAKAFCVKVGKGPVGWAARPGRACTTTRRRPRGRARGPRTPPGGR